MPSAQARLIIGTLVVIAGLVVFAQIRRAPVEPAPPLAAVPAPSPSSPATDAAREREEKQRERQQEYEEAVARAREAEQERADRAVREREQSGAPMRTNPWATTSVPATTRSPARSSELERLRREQRQRFADEAARKKKIEQLEASLKQLEQSKRDCDVAQRHDRHFITVNCDTVEPRIREVEDEIRRLRSGR